MASQFKEDPLFSNQFDKAINNLPNGEVTSENLPHVATFGFHDRYALSEMWMTVASRMQNQGFGTEDFEALLGPREAQVMESVLIGKGKGPYLLGFRGASTWMLIMEPDAVASVAKAKVNKFSNLPFTDELADSISASFQVLHPKIADSTEATELTRQIYQENIEQPDKMIVRYGAAGEPSRADWMVMGGRGGKPTQEWYLALDPRNNLSVEQALYLPTQQIRYQFNIRPNGSVAMSEGIRPANTMSYTDTPKRLTESTLIVLQTGFNAKTAELLEKGVDPSVIEKIQTSLSQAITKSSSGPTSS